MSSPQLDDPNEDRALSGRAAGYVGWLEAAVEAAGSKKRFGEAVKAAGRIILDRQLEAVRTSDDHTALERAGRERLAWASVSPASTSTVGGWLKGQIPAGADDFKDKPRRRGHPLMREALIAAVQSLVPVVPDKLDTWGSFAQVVKGAAAAKAQRLTRGSEAGTGAIRATAKAKQTGELEGWLIGAAKQTPDQIDALGLRLGSWLTEGLLPPYVRREADDGLDAIFADPDRRLVVLVGQPKSGKTRSLLEALRRARPTCRVWWALAHPDTVKTLTAHAAKDPDPGSIVVVLDDLHQHTPGIPDGLTGNTLHHLIATGVTVTVTIHATTLVQLEENAVDHRLGTLTGMEDRIGSDPRLAHLLSANCLTYESELTDSEQAVVPSELHEAAEAHGISVMKLERLAELLAAVDQLLATCERARRDHRRPNHWAIVRAAIDANYLYPAGATPEQLAQLTAWAYEELAPTRPWNPTLFETALDWAATPIGGHRSPHSIIQPAPDHSYHVFDALISRLHPKPWIPEHLQANLEELPPEAQFRAGNAYVQIGDLERAEPWWRKGAEAGHSAEMFNLGMLRYQQGRTADGDDDSAAVWWKRCAASGLPQALFNLGGLRYQQGRTADSDPDGAVAWYKKAAKAGHAAAMNSLGALREEQGRTADADPDGAIAWWMKAAEGNLAKAMVNLGRLRAAQDRTADSDPDGAVAWYKKAAWAGDTEAMNNMGALRQRQGRTADDDPDGAEAWYTRVAAADEPIGMLNLGCLREGQGRLDDDDPDGAVIWWKRAAAGGQPAAMCSLGFLREHQGRTADGDPDGAVAWWTKAAQAGDVAAMCCVGILRERQGRHGDLDPDSAVAWWKKAAELGHAGAMRSLGTLRRTQGRTADGDPDGAVGWWKRAAEHADTHAMCSLGLLRHEEGRRDEVEPDGAMAWWRKAAALGHAGAMFNLGLERHEQGRTEDGDPDGAMAWWRKAAALGHAGAMFNLGLERHEQGRTEDGDPDGAMAWWRKAAEHGHTGAITNLGRLRHKRGRTEDADDDSAVG